MLEPAAVAADAPFPYDRAQYEEIPCNLCGGRDVETVADRDRNGLRVRSVICGSCGFIFISPRMTPAWYGRYYEVEYKAELDALPNFPLRAWFRLNVPRSKRRIRRGAGRLFNTLKNVRGKTKTGA